MILEIQHETQLDYSEPVSESITELHMEPANDGEQSCHSFKLRLTPYTQDFRYRDGFGNYVHHFNLLEPHDHVGILAASIVETRRLLPDLQLSCAVHPLSLPSLPLEAYDFLKLRGPVSPTPLLEPLLKAVGPHEGALLGSLLVDIAHYIHDKFEYAPAATLASSPIGDLLSAGKGVCQDFTHLMIAILRSLGIPARYVSGYLHRPGSESQSHAWCEAWLPDLGWVGIDPTNDCIVNDRFVRVAVGRDFCDVPPNKGIFRGRGYETISVRVATRELERLPALTWQEQLPPLQIPLTAITNRRHLLTVDDEETQQQ
jgi:transglutaminase-like putative cysteine protease